MTEVVFRPLAEADLISLYDYIAHDSGFGVAAGYISRIEAACQSIATFPERGRRRDDLLPGLRTVGFERRVTIAYSLIEGRIEIIAIAYGGRAFEGNLAV